MLDLCQQFADGLIGNDNHTKCMAICGRPLAGQEVLNDRDLSEKRANDWHPLRDDFRAGRRSKSSEVCPLAGGLKIIEGAAVPGVH